MKQALDTLNDLLMLDHDAVKAYGAAIERIDIPLAREKLSAFRDDHVRHIRDLRAMVEQLGGHPKDHVDARGPFLQAVTAARALVSPEQALRAMKSNEEITNRQYAEALAHDLSSEAQELVRRNYADEQRHLAWLNQAIQDRIWERAGGEAHP